MANKLNVISTLSHIFNVSMAWFMQVMKNLKKQVTFVKSYEKSHENFKILIKVMKAVIEKKSAVSAAF